MKMPTIKRRPPGARSRRLRGLVMGVAGVFAVLAALLVGSSSAQAADGASDGVSTLGRKELVRVLAPDTGRSAEEFARIDTGAARSSIDTDLAEKLGLDLKNAEKIEVKSSLGQEERPIVWVTLQIDGRSIPTRVTVNDRSHLSSAILVGRD